MVLEGVCEILYQGGDCWKLILIFHLEEEVRGVQEEAAKKTKKRKKKRKRKEFMCYFQAQVDWGIS